LEDLLTRVGQISKTQRGPFRTKIDARDDDDERIVSVCFQSVFSNAATLGMTASNINSTRMVNTLGQDALKNQLAPRRIQIPET